MSIAVEAQVESQIESPAVVIHGVTWNLYEQLLKATAEQNLRVTYDEGVLEITSPLPEHETAKKVIGGFIEMVAVELNIPMRRLGSTTFKKRSLRKGTEADECYYIQHEKQVRGKKRLDLRRDPPPDLVLEVDISYHTIDKRGVYAAMGVPEIWSYEAGKLAYLHLKRGKYEAQETSLALPFIRSSHIHRFLKMLDESDETTVFRAWQKWVRKAYPSQD